MLAQSQHIPNIVLSPRARLHTCCDLSDSTLELCREKFGALHVTKDFHAAINNPEVDAICIATTEKLRRPVIEAAARAAKPVYCEKPIAQDLKELYAIQKVVKESGIPFCAGHNRRSSPAMQDAYRIFRAHMDSPQPCLWRFDREGELRPPLPEDGTASMSIRINDDWYSWKAWVFDKAQAPHGPMLFEMTHFTDLCNWFLAAEPEEVVAMEHGMLNHAIIIRYKTGELATLMMTGNGTFGYPKELYELFGNGAAVTINHMLEVRTAGITNEPAKTLYPLLGAQVENGNTPEGPEAWFALKQAGCAQAIAQQNPMLALSFDANKGHAHAIDRFIDEIQGNGPTVCSIDDAVQATRVAFAAIRSAKEKRTVYMHEI